MSDHPRYLAVGRIGRAHGVKGEMSILPLSQVGTRFQSGSRLFAGEGTDRPMVVSSSRQHGKRLLVSFEGVLDRDGAEALQGTYLFVPASEAPPLPEGEYWTHQLIGCEVFTEGGRTLGHLREVIHTRANDVWSVQGEDGSDLLVPALKDVVGEVDVDARRIVVREVPGLTVP